MHFKYFTILTFLVFFSSFVTQSWANDDTPPRDVDFIEAPPDMLNNNWAGSEDPSVTIKLHRFWYDSYTLHDINKQDWHYSSATNITYAAKKEKCVCPNNKAHCGIYMIKDEKGHTACLCVHGYAGPDVCGYTSDICDSGEEWPDLGELGRWCLRIPLAPGPPPLCPSLSDQILPPKKTSYNIVPIKEEGDGCTPLYLQNKLSTNQLKFIDESSKGSILINSIAAYDNSPTSCTGNNSLVSRDRNLLCGYYCNNGLLDRKICYPLGSEDETISQNYGTLTPDEGGLPVSKGSASYSCKVQSDTYHNYNYTLQDKDKNIPYKTLHIFQLATPVLKPCTKNALGTCREVNTLDLTKVSQDFLDSIVYNPTSSLLQIAQKDEEPQYYDYSMGGQFFVKNIANVNTSNCTTPDILVTNKADLRKYLSSSEVDKAGSAPFCLERQNFLFSDDNALPENFTLDKVNSFVQNPILDDLTTLYYKRLEAACNSHNNELCSIPRLNMYKISKNNPDVCSYNTGDNNFTCDNKNASVLVLIDQIHSKPMKFFIWQKKLLDAIAEAYKNANKGENKGFSYKITSQQNDNKKIDVMLTVYPGIEPNIEVDKSKEGTIITYDPQSNSLTLGGQIGDLKINITDFVYFVSDIRDKSFSELIRQNEFKDVYLIFTSLPS